MTPSREEKIRSVLSKRQPGLGVVLENIQDPRNVTAIMRTCDAVGVQELFVIADQRALPKRFGFKSARGTDKWVDLHLFGSTAACFQAVRHRFEKVFATSLSDTPKGLYELDLTGSTALVFGNEATGVSEEALALSDGSFLVPMVGMVQSLNVSVACAVSLYEAFRQKTLAGHYDTPALSNARTEELLSVWSKQ